MAVQNSFFIPCPPQTAFECAINTLKTFKNTEKMHINPRFFTVTTTIYHHSPGETISMLKVFSISIQSVENSGAQMQLTCDHMPGKMNSSGGILFTIAEFLDRYSQMLNQMEQESANVQN